MNSWFRCNELLAHQWFLSQEWNSCDKKNYPFTYKICPFLAPLLRKSALLINQSALCFEKYPFAWKKYPFTQKVALLFRKAFLINSILTNSESWYGVKMEEIEMLEQVDEIFLRKILEVGKSCPKEMLYLETASRPIRFIIMSRRLMFLH